MSPRRTPAPPPRLPGFIYAGHLGSGGFADVYLFEQELPRRRVAVKVLLPDRLAQGADRFAAEANTMALLSTHPAIVTIYQAGTSDDGRPYLVMEYCPKPNLQARYREAPFSVAEALRVGIQVAAAVETAHRAGVMHRDIKPANILVTEYNRPALTDFGIATVSDGADDSGAGMSIPWSPPEVLIDETNGGVRGDVYALGATVYSLLAGRSPFEIPGASNASADLIPRIERAPLPPIGRADVPSSLVVALERSMAKRPTDRYDSALAFARALQKIQIELSQSVTPIDLLDEALPDPGPDRDDDPDGTRVRGLVSIAPEASTADAAAAWAPAPGAPGQAPVPAADGDRTIVRVASLDPGAARSRIDDERTVARPRTLDAQGALDQQPVAPPPPTPPRRVGLWIGVGAALVVLAAAAVAIPLVTSSMTTSAPPAKPENPGASYAPQNPAEDVVPQVQDLAGTVGADGVTFTWSNPAAKAGDAYLWGKQIAGAEPSLSETKDGRVTLPADPSGRTCIEVYLKRSNGTASSSPATACAP